MRGRLAAQVDMQRGQYQVLGYGLPSPSRPEYARCLRERYEIDFRPVAGCVVSESLLSYVNAYDSVLEEAALRKFGRDVFKECAEASATKWEAQRLAAAQDVKVRKSSRDFNGDITPANLSVVDYGPRHYAWQS